MKISIVMPYFNREDDLTAAVIQYRKLYPHLELEIVVCDDGSIPPLQAPDGVRVVHLEPKSIALNPCVPINAAIRESTGDIVVLTNPEVLHTENVLDGMLVLLREPKDYVTVACQHVDGSWLAGPETEYHKGGRWPIPRGSHFHFCAMFYRSLFNEVGGFDEFYRFGQGGDDGDWLWKVYEAGAKFKTAPGVVHHNRGERSKWFGGLEANKYRYYDKWSHLDEFFWSDAGLAERMAAGWQGGLAQGTPCGSGSTPEATANVREWLPKVFKEYDIWELVDAGAGDLSWIKSIRVPSGFNYRPFDLVSRRSDVTEADITQQVLPRCDAILCRHVLIHLDPPRIEAALNLFRKSAQYLIASQYPNAAPFDPKNQFNRTDLTKYLGEPLQRVADTLEPDCYLAIWYLPSC